MSTKRSRPTRHPSHAIQAFYLELQAPETSPIKHEEVRNAVVQALRLAYPALRNLTTAPSLTERKAAGLLVAGVCLGIVLVLVLVIMFGG